MKARKRELLTQGWRLAVIEDKQIPENAVSMKEIEKTDATVISAYVPGNFELDLMREGLLNKDAYIGDGCLELRKYETCHLYYSLIFHREELSGDKEFIVFEGVDTLADVYLNGELIGSCDNMMIEHKFLATSVKPGKNELFVHIKPVCLEARDIPCTLGVSSQNYNHESAVVRKAAHTFGWDITPRAVSGGIWKDVYYETLATPNIKETHLIAREYDKDSGIGFAQFRYATDIGRDHVSDYKISIQGRCGTSVFSEEKTLMFPTGKIDFKISDCKVWNIRGRGEQNLYDVVATLKKNDTVVDTKSFRFGYRTVTLENTEILDDDNNGTFRFIVNGEPVYLMGSNWVPADMFHSKDKDRIADMVKLAYECGCNALRCWGGNVYENDLFYDLCDEYGILVWQDFAMACGYYPQDKRMQKLFEKEAEAVIKRLRQHPCVCVWAGDNECDWEISSFENRDPSENVLTRVILPEAIKNHDATRPYLPSSPYISKMAFDKKKRERITEQHLWGDRPFFKAPYYSESKACFVSEIGYHGSVSPESMRKFIDADYYWPAEGNLQWKLHGGSPTADDNDFTYRVPLMFRLIGNLFDEKPSDFDTFAAMSQVVQAEAYKYFIESFRMRKGHTSGLIWWNLIDCWPEFSDSVVDYYFVKKLAFSYIKVSQQQFCLAMDDKDGKLTLYALNDYPYDIEFSYNIVDSETGAEIAKGEEMAKADCSQKILQLEKPAENKFYKIAWEIKNPSHEVKTGSNHYLSFEPFISYEWYMEHMKLMEDYQFYGF